MLKELIYELSRGLAYRRIRHPEMWKYTTGIPLLVYALLLLLYWALPVAPVWLGKDGVVGGLLAIVSTLPGFYFAGLAAVATFGSETMDREMEAPPAIDIFVAGAWVENKLSKRQFLSYLFSYLVIASFFLCFGLLALNALEGALSAWQKVVSNWTFGARIWEFGRFCVGSIFALTFASMLVTTLHGIFFLTERIHQP